jgi:putative DNA primase/helicase
MGAVVNSFARSERVDFRAVSSAALAALEMVVPRLLPGGMRSSNEWVSRNPTRHDGHPGSFKVNMTTGVWSDFATGDKGGDAIDLVVYLTGKSKVDAARDLATLLNVSPPENSTSLTGNLPPIRTRKTASAALPSVSQIAPPSFPPRTAPDNDGKPRFILASEDGPRVRDNEKRRHVYRRGGVPVRIKILRKDGEVFNVYRVTDVDGATGWQYRTPEGFESVPYINSLPPISDETPIFWPEGEKDQETLSKLGLNAITFGGTGDGLPIGCSAYFAGRHVIILADNDPAPKKEQADMRPAGLKHAQDKAQALVGVAKSIRIVEFPDTPEKGDVSDWIHAGHTAQELLDRADATTEWGVKTPEAATTTPAVEVVVDDITESKDVQKQEPVPAKKSKLPRGYSFSELGLMWSDPDDLDKPASFIAGCFDIEAETRDAEGANWGVLLHWRDNDNRDHRMALPRASLAGDGSEARRLLMDGGLFVSPTQRGRQLLNSFLLQVKSENRARATQRVGWHESAFVLPDECFGTGQNDKWLLQSVTSNEHSFRQSGTLEDWKENVAKYAVGNSRLVLAMSAAFAAPMVNLFSAEGGGLHFRGASSTGKSTALHVAGSVWGGGDANGYIRSWRATANGLEGVALGHSDTLLCLDELSQLAAKDAGESAYMLANGSGKSRSSRDGTARKAARWRVLFLSSGEIGLADKVAEDGRGKKLAAGQQIRIVDISADAGAGMGMFENIHQFRTAEEMARHLNASARQFYGVASRTFLRAIIPMTTEYRQALLVAMREFCDQFVPAGADGQVERVAQRFAMVAVAGELARENKIVPWPEGEALRAAARCFDDWLQARGGSESAETRDGIEQVRSFILAHGMSRFIPAWDSSRDDRVAPRDVVGYREKIEGGGWDYFVTTTAWKEEVCRGTDARRLAAVLAQKGYLNAPDETRRARQVRVPGHGQQRLYHVLSKLLEDDDSA